MIVFCIFLNIYLPYSSFVISTCIETSGSTATFGYVVMISSPINLVCDFIFTSFVAKIASTFSCSSILCRSFSSRPPPLRSYGFFGYTSPS